MDKKWVSSIIVVLLCALSLAAVAQDDEQVDVPGQIAYIGTDFNVYRLDPRDNRHTQLTEDAGAERRYQWPTWATDGRLAYFSTFIDDSSIFMGVYVSADADDLGEEVYRGEQEAFNYAYWSPQNCSTSETCRDLAILVSSQTKGMFVELVRDGDAPTNLTAGIGGPPFYYSWSPDGTRMLWQRDNQRLDVYDAASDSVVDTLPQTPGIIFAPAWSPVDDRLLFGALNTEEQATDLIVVGHDEVVTLAEGLTGLVSYGWSPDGNYVAYRTVQEAGYGTLFVVNALTGEVVSRSPVEGVIAFFWSPDSQQVAYVTLATAPGAFSAGEPRTPGLAAPIAQEPIGIAWSVLKVNDDSAYRYGAFIPTEEMIYILRYFDQFAQSHRVWSPDSTHLLYSEVIDSDPMINLLDVTREDSVPFSVAEGRIGIWSFD
jgi:TolB protein